MCGNCGQITSLVVYSPAVYLGMQDDSLHIFDVGDSGVYCPGCGTKRLKVFSPCKACSAVDMQRVMVSDEAELPGVLH